MKIFSVLSLSVFGSYFILLLYAAICSSIGIKLPNNIFDHYVIIVICVFIATIFYTVKKRLTTPKE